MLKKIIYDYIYNDELSEEEIEYYCDYEDGRGWYVRSSVEWDMYEHRREELVRDLQENGVHNIFNLALEDNNNKMAEVLIRYLEDYKV